MYLYWKTGLSTYTNKIASYEKWEDEAWVCETFFDEKIAYETYKIEFKTRVNKHDMRISIGNVVRITCKVGSIKSDKELSELNERINRRMKKKI